MTELPRRYGTPIGIGILLLFEEIHTVLLARFHARLKKESVCLRNTVVSDEEVAKGILHQTVDGHMHHGPKIRPSFVDVSQHSPLEQTFISLFFEHVHLSPVPCAR